MNIYHILVILRITLTFTLRPPCIGLLSMGSDPTSAIEEIAKKMNQSYTAVSMGQGQEIHARKLLLTYMTTVSHR